YVVTTQLLLVVCSDSLNKIVSYYPSDIQFRRKWVALDGSSTLYFARKVKVTGRYDNEWRFGLDGLEDFDGVNEAEQALEALLSDRQADKPYSKNTGKHKPDNIKSWSELHPDVQEAVVAELRPGERVYWLEKIVAQKINTIYSILSDVSLLLHLC
ncbi:MAG: hypothetical protein P8Y67_13830, partial [Alphaproteobacteria bacterium]